MKSVTEFTHLAQGYHILYMLNKYCLFLLAKGDSQVLGALIREDPQGKLSGSFPAGYRQSIIHKPYGVLSAVGEDL